MQTPNDFEILTVAELIVAVGRLNRCKDVLGAIDTGIKLGIMDTKDIQKITTDTLDWLTKDECEKGVVE